MNFSKNSSYISNKNAKKCNKTLIKRQNENINKFKEFVFFQNRKRERKSLNGMRKSNQSFAFRRRVKDENK